MTIDCNKLSPSGTIEDSGSDLSTLVRCFIKHETPDPYPQIAYQGGRLARPQLSGTSNRFLYLETNVKNAVVTEATFALISPKLNNKIITRLLTLLKQYRITCGFSIDKVHLYDRVIFIDPNHDYDDTLGVLKEAEIKVDTLSSEGDLRENLRKLLSE